MIPPNIGASLHHVRAKVRVVGQWRDFKGEKEIVLWRDGAHLRLAIWQIDARLSAHARCPSWIRRVVQARNSASRFDRLRLPMFGVI